MKIPDRLLWTLFRRLKLMRSVTGFWAHWTSYADGLCSFSEEDELYDGSFLSCAKLGRFTYAAAQSTVRRAVIGSFCSIAPEARIGGLGRHPVNFLSTHPVFYSKKRRQSATLFDQVDIEELPAIYIGHDVWIGARAMVMNGVSIGNGAIIAANAVVTKDIEPYAIVGGVPATIIRMRFSDAVISRLQSWQWWNLPTAVLRNLFPFFNRTEWSESNLDEMISISQKQLIKK